MPQDEVIQAYFDLNSEPLEASFDLADPNTLEAKLEINVASSTVFWGSIFGNLQDQPDLVQALELLYPKSNPENYTSNTITFKIWYKDDTNTYTVVSDDNNDVVLDIGSQQVVSDTDGNIVLSNAVMTVEDDNNGNLIINGGEISNG